MANNPSARKRIRQTVKKTAVNKSRMNKMRTFIKKFEQLIDGKDTDHAKQAFDKAQSVIAKTAQKGTIHKNTAKRKISRLAHKLKQIVD